jgi:streptogramin lyase
MGKGSIVCALLVAACADTGRARDSGANDAGSGIVTAGTDDGAATSESGDAGDVGDDAADGLDLPNDGPDPAPCGPGGGADVEWSYIWIANTEEGTVSKIDTMTGVEEGRYATGPHHPEGSPSRTSVNQFGDAVVVNRLPGGIAKIAATDAACIDANGNGAIETSSGPADVLPWGTDECVLWSTEIPSPALLDHGPRPVAWEGVEAMVQPDGGCTHPEPRVWVAYLEEDLTAKVWRIAGDSGALLDEVEIPWGEDQPYGGAVDGDGDFWMVAESDEYVVEVDAETLAWTNHPPQADYYGVAMDAEGHVWGGVSSEGAISHFDAAAGTFVKVATPGVGRVRGLQVDEARHVWGAGNDPCALVEVDGNTDTLVDDAIALPGCDDPVGVSIDVEGFVWVVDRGANRAYKVDPATHAVVLTVEGLVGPYTYSDMTGHGLKLVTQPPAG